MKIKNGELEGLIKFLDVFSLVGTESRMRTRFKKLLIEYYTRFYEERAEIINRYGKRDENNELIKRIEDDKEVIELENVQSFNKEFEELSNEYTVIDETEERQQMFTTVKNIILNCPIAFHGADADRYDDVCELFENLKYGEM